MKNVLIVDSNPIMLAAFVGLLKSQSGFLNVLSAKTGKGALEVIAGKKIHVVITGLNLRRSTALNWSSFWRNTIRISASLS